MYLRVGTKNESQRIFIKNQEENKVVREFNLPGWVFGYKT